MKREHIDQWKPHFLDRSPMFEPLRQAGQLLNQLEQWPTPDQLNHLLSVQKPNIRTNTHHPLRFVAQTTSTSLFEQQYEPRTYLCGELQTRAQNWHDLFNALVWMTFPQSKAQLNALHYHALKIAEKQPRSARGRLRDAITLLDESGILVTSSHEDLTCLLKNFEWKTLFWENRSDLLQHMKFFLFGHSLYEKALSPYVGMTGKGLVFHIEPSFYQQDLHRQIVSLDNKLANLLSTKSITSTDLTPIPLLGYPDWSPDNSNATYYDNSDYFRPRSSRKTT